VVTKVFGLSSEQYEAMRDVFDDVNSPDPMGIYQLTADPSKYAIVLRLPERDKYAALKMGGTAGAGVFVGVLGKMAHERWKDEREKWFEAYKKFLLHSERLHITLKDLEIQKGIDRQPIALPDEVRLQTPPSDEMKGNIFDWQYCELFPTKGCHKTVASWSGVNFPPNLARKLISQGKSSVREDVYYSTLFAPSYNKTVEKQVELLLQDAKVVDEQYEIMKNNKKWMRVEIDPSKPFDALD
jgi:hypothetical protein